MQEFLWLGAVRQWTLAPLKLSGDMDRHSSSVRM